MAREQCKTVTVLFRDLAGSAALGESIDPERLRTLVRTTLEAAATQGPLVLGELEPE